MIWCIFKGSHWLLEVGPWKRASIEGGKQVRSKYSGIRESGKLELEWEVMQVVKIGQILNIFLDIWANIMCSWIGCGVWEKGIKDDGFPPPQSTHLSNQVKDAKALYWDRGRLGREDYSINLVSFVLDMPRVWDAYWTNSVGNWIVKTGVQGKVRTGATYWESSACVWYLKPWDQLRSECG